MSVTVEVEHARKVAPRQSLLQQVQAKADELGTTGSTWLHGYWTDFPVFVENTAHTLGNGYHAARSAAARFEKHLRNSLSELSEAAGGEKKQQAKRGGGGGGGVIDPSALDRTGQNDGDSSVAADTKPTSSSGSRFGRILNLFVPSSLDLENVSIKVSAPLASVTKDLAGILPRSLLEIGSQAQERVRAQLNRQGETIRRSAMGEKKIQLWKQDKADADAVKKVSAQEDAEKKATAASAATEPAQLVAVAIGSAVGVLVFCGFLLWWAGKKKGDRGLLEAPSAGPSRTATPR